MEKVLKITNCLDCPHHKVIADPDPTDWFCDDDVAVVCTKTKNNNRNNKSSWVSDRQDYQIVTSACRPHHIRKESDVPKWCPLADAIKIKKT